MSQNYKKKKDGYMQSQRKFSMQLQQKPEEKCDFCGEVHKPEELKPYEEPFPQIPLFPREGIFGMYPVQTTCKKTIMNNLLQFRKKLLEQAEKTKMWVKMMEYRNMTAEAEEPEDRVATELDQLSADIQLLKQELNAQGTGYM